MPQLYVLFEHASGFAVFRTTEFEEVGLFLPQVRQSITDISKFRSIVFLVAFQPFKTQKDALQNMKSIAADELSSDLQLFLENNIPRSKKTKQSVVLGVQEPSLATVISEKLGINCLSTGVIKEIIRGVRFHFPKLLKGFTDSTSASKTQLALAHHFSREKTNFDARRQDCMVIQSHSLVDELEKDINTLTKRIKEWYSIHFPELYNILQGSTELYIRCIQEIGDRQNMPEDIKEKLTAVVEDSRKVEAILKAVHNSMGMEISPVDLENMQMFCQRVLDLIKKRQMSLDYLKAKMNSTAPNVSALVGELVGSRLISRAGGLTNLARLPSSTVQVLGADKKLFRTVKGKEKAEKFGLISKSAFIGKAGKTKKGHLARILANKCSLAARVDCFSKKSNEAFGCKLIQEVEQIIKLHKKFRSDIKSEKEKTEDESKVSKEKAVKKRKSTKGVKSIDSNTSSVDICTTLNNEDSPKENVLNLSNNKIQQKGKEIMSSCDKDDNIEESLESEMSVDENILNSSCKKMKPKRKKILDTFTKDNKSLELLTENIPKKRKGPSKKRKSKSLESSVTESLEENVSEMPEKDVEIKKPVKRSMRLRAKLLQT